MNRRANQQTAWVSTFTLLSFYYLISQALVAAQDNAHTNTTTTAAPPSDSGHDDLSFLQIIEIIGLATASILLFCAIMCCWRKCCASKGEFDFSEGGGYEGFKDNCLPCFFSSSQSDAGLYRGTTQHSTNSRQSSSHTEEMRQKYRRDRKQEDAKKHSEERTLLLQRS